MNGPKPFFRTPGFVVLLLTFFLFLLYASLQGHQGNAGHLFRRDRTIYVSMEGYGSLVEYEVFASDFASLAEQHPVEFSAPQKIFTLKDSIPPKTLDVKLKKELTFPGNVVSSELYSGTLFVVDELTGIYRYWVGQSENLTEPALPFYGARDIALSEGLVYVAGGEAGIYVYASINQTAPLSLIGVGDTSGTAEALDLVARMGKEVKEEPDPGGGPPKIVEVEKIVSSTLFVADGEGGVVVMNVTQPMTPTRTVTISREGYVHNVLVENSTLYVSQGVQGWSMVDVTDPAKYKPLVFFDTNGDVRDIAVNDDYIAVANGNNGLWVYRNAADLLKTPQVPVVVDIPGFVSNVELVKNYAILTVGVEGVRVVDLANANRPVIRDSSATPGEYTFQQVWANRSQPEDSAEREKFDRSLKDLYNEGFMLLVGTGIMLLFVSLATLPAYNLPYWLQRGRSQPVMVEGGQIVSPRLTRHPDRMRAIHIDTGSAIAAVSPNRTRWLGPGLGFLQPRERVGRTLDLRPALLITGPLYDEDPFVLEVPGETAQQRQARQARRNQTWARTRDNIAIVPNLLVDVRVAGTPGDGGSEYGYTQQNAQLAMQPDLEAYDQTLPFMSPAVGWYDLVTNLGTQLWLQYLAKYTLEELFTPLPPVQTVFPGAARTGLQRVAWMMQRHLTRASVPRLDETGQPTGQMLQSAHFAALSLRGLTVSRLQVINLRLEPGFDQNLQQDCLDTWVARADEGRAQVLNRQAQRQARALRAARMRFAKVVRQPYESLVAQPGTQDTPLSDRQILISRVQGTLNLSVLSPELRQQLEDLLANLGGWTDGA